MASDTPLATPLVQHRAYVDSGCSQFNVSLMLTLCSQCMWQHHSHESRNLRCLVPRIIRTLEALESQLSVRSSVTNCKDWKNQDVSLSAPLFPYSRFVTNQSAKLPVSKIPNNRGIFNL